jgi:hypothetical protein
MDGFQRTLLARMPLAQSVLWLFSYLLTETFLNRLFEEDRGRCYEDKLTFPTLVYLIRDALVVHEGSGRASFVRAQADQSLPTSIRAPYGKLGRMPLELSMAFLRQSTIRLGELVPSDGRVLPPSLSGFVCVVFDGKTLKHVQRRLKPLRNRRGKINSGKMLVALSLRSGLALAFNGSPNSEANDVSLVEGLLGQMGAGAGETRLFIADAQFCDLPRLIAFSGAGHHFLVRHNRNIHFHPDAQRRQRTGTDAEGRQFVQEWGWLGRAGHPQRQYVRRVTLRRPGEDDIAVVTDLLDSKQYPAQDLLAAYLQRWGIEPMFQQVTEVFDLKHLIGGTPQATLFQAAFCLLLYNMIQVVKAYVAQAGDKAVEEVSTANLFEDCRMELVSWATLGDPEAAMEMFGAPLEAVVVKRQLQELLGGLWRDRWLKAPAQRKHGKTRQTIYPHKGYTNVWKVLEAQRRLQRRSKQ